MTIKAKICATAVAVLTVGVAHAQSGTQNFPSRPLRLIIPMGAGYLAAMPFAPKPPDSPATLALGCLICRVCVSILSFCICVFHLPLLRTLIIHSPLLLCMLTLCLLRFCILVHHAPAWCIAVAASVIVLVYQ